MPKKVIPKKPSPLKGKKKPQKKLTIEQWAMIRHLWCIDEGHTFKALSQQFGISETTVKKKSQKEKWKSQKPEIKQKIKESMIETFVRLGLEKDEFFNMIIEGARATKRLHNVKDIAKRKGTDGEMVPITNRSGAPITFERTIQVVDNDTTLKYRQEIAKFCGFNAAPKTAVHAEGELKDKVIPVVSHLNLNNSEPEPEPKK